MVERYRNRQEAGRELAGRLLHYAGAADLQVLALPRGGVPVGFEVARGLRAPLDVFVVRKLGVPGQPELAMGAIGSGGIRVINADVVEALGIDEAVLNSVAEREQQELRRRELAYRGDHPPPPLTKRRVILVDDGLATGATMRAAVVSLRTLDPARIVVAVPVAAAEALAEISKLCDEVVCPLTPRRFSAVGEWYDDFAETSDDDVRELLSRSSREPPHRFGGSERLC
jgi:putative phosphoribosyl transferase